MKRLSLLELTAALDELGGWTVQDDKLYKAYRFDTFVEAFGFMSRVGLIAEKMDHHPELFNAYNQVEIHLFTHEVGGITALDTEFAGRIDRLD